jgi:lysozyme
MKPSPEIAEFIKAWEGCSLKLYFCSAGKPTIGYGHLLEPHEPQPDYITQAQADAYFRRDLDDHAQAVDDLVAVDIAQHEYDALVSWTFNFGHDKLMRSTLLRKVNDRRFDDAAHEFARWVYAGEPPKKVPGLVRRRDAECAIFEKADYSGRP